MHLLIPFAYCHTEGCARTLPTLALPNLTRLLQRLQEHGTDRGDASSLSPPHERAQAQALGLPQADGQIPWAAWQQACTPAGNASTSACAFITPCHWQVGSRQVVMHGALADFTANESQAILQAMQPYFMEDDIDLQYQQATRWLARGAVLADLACASLDRVCGRDVRDWMARGAAAPKLHRLQAEMQMLLHQHPVNEAREARGLLPVNSFWVSGAGTLPTAWQPSGDHAVLSVVTTLRDAAVAADWPAWAQAWTALDAQECAALLQQLRSGGAARLTLCGEHHALQLGPKQHPAWQRVSRQIRPKHPCVLLEQL